MARPNPKPAHDRVTAIALLRAGSSLNIAAGVARFLSLPIALAWLLGFASIASIGAAQPVDSIPDDFEPWPGLGQPERPPLPAERRDGTERLQVLPPLPPHPASARDPGAATFVLTDVIFEGNTVFDDAELSAVITPWLGRTIATTQLLDLRNVLTRHYIANGYITSGARIPDQTPHEGLVQIQIVESRIGAIEFTHSTRLDPRYVERRIELDRKHPLQLARLERRLRLIQQSADLRRLDARIEPGSTPGRDRLVLAIEEKPLVFGWAQSGTLISPSLGGFAARAGAQVRSPAGHADRARVQFAGAEGLLDFQGEYAMPWGPWETTLTLRGRYGESRVVADPIEDLDIDTRFVSAGFEIAQPVWRERDQHVELGLIGEWQEGRTRQGGRRTSFSEGAENGRFRVSALRLFAAARFQSARQVIALRSTWSVGLDVLDATTQPSGIEDGRFFSWLGQLQLLRSLEMLPVDVLIRGNVQLANDRLLPIERFSVGGRESVRGYRENLFVRDNGMSGSLEIRWPILRALDRRRTLEVFTFVDAGRSWTTERAGNVADDLAAIGLGLRASPWRWLEVELSWAGRLTDRPSVLEDDIQDDGLFLRVQVASF